MGARFSTIAAAALTLLLGSSAQAVGQEARPPRMFPVAKVRFEQNATDGDVEVVFDVTGRAAGLTSLVITAPDGRTVIDFKAPDRTTLGMRQFVLESPEPKDVAGLKAAYPEGEYSFHGATATGEKLEGKAALNHELPVTSEFVLPRANARDVPLDGLEIEWVPVQGMAAYIVEIEQDELDVNITAKLPGSAKSFVVPAGFLRPGQEYQLGIGTVSKAGNISYIETHFTTATRK
jgi:hypothetical protein